MMKLLPSLALMLLPAALLAQPAEIAPAEPAQRQLPLEFDGPPPRTSYPPVVPATSPLRRVAPAESRLTCEDYSMSYFRRHPAMAAVCGVDPHAEETAVSAVQPASSTVPSPTQP